MVGDAHHQRHVVLDEQHREPEVVTDPPDRLAQLVDLAVGEPRRGLVEEEEAGRGRQGPRQLEPLEGAEGQAGGGTERVLREPEALEQLVRPPTSGPLLAPRWEP